MYCNMMMESGALKKLLEELYKSEWRSIKALAIVIVKNCMKQNKAWLTCRGAITRKVAQGAVWEVTRERERGSVPMFGFRDAAKYATNGSSGTSRAAKYRATYWAASTTIAEESEVDLCLAEQNRSQEDPQGEPPAMDIYRFFLMLLRYCFGTLSLIAIVVAIRHVFVGNAFEKRKK